MDTSTQPSTTTTTVTITAITIDCADALATATFWSELTGLALQDGATTEAAALGGGPVALCFAAVPEPKSTKNRVHLDLHTDRAGGQDDRDIELGARVETAFDGWTVLVDPFGNEFCLVG